MRDRFTETRGQHLTGKQEKKLKDCFFFTQTYLLTSCSVPIIGEISIISEESHSYKNDNDLVGIYCGKSSAVWERLQGETHKKCQVEIICPLVVTNITLYIIYRLIGREVGQREGRASQFSHFPISDPMSGYLSLQFHSLVHKSGFFWGGRGGNYEIFHLTCLEQNITKG